MVRGMFALIFKPLARNHTFYFLLETDFVCLQLNAFMMFLMLETNA